MKPLLVALCVSLFFLAGCGSTYVIPTLNAQPGQENIVFDYSIFPGDNVTSDITSAPGEFYDFDIR